MYIISEGMQNLEYLLKQARVDENAFKEIYNLTIDRVFNYVLLRVRNREDAKDIVQEIYNSFWKSLPKFEFISEEHFYGFLWKVVRRRIFWFRKKDKKTLPLEDIYDVPDELENPEDYRKLLQAVSLLKPKQRLVIELRYFSHLQFNEIAKMIGIKEVNAKVLHHRAIKILKNHNFIKEYDLR